MGKRVFEVAKDLGVDHRDLLKKCSALQIDVRNYMSVLSGEQERKLRESVEADRERNAVEESVQAPGWCGAGAAPATPDPRPAE